MKGFLAMKHLTDIDDRFIQAARLPEVEDSLTARGAASETNRRAGKRRNVFMHSGWAAAGISLVVGVSLYLVLLGFGNGTFDNLFAHKTETAESERETSPTEPETQNDTDPTDETESEAQTEWIPDVAWGDHGVEFVSGENGTCSVSLVYFRGEYLRIPETSPDGDRVTSVTGVCRTSGVRYVYVPDGVTVIADMVFKNCTELEYVRLPDSLCEIGESAFCNTGLRELVLPGGVRSVGASALSDNQQLMRVVLPDGLTSLPNGLFSQNRVLSEVILPSGLESIGNFAFYGCDSLTEISLPEGLTQIGMCAFSFCSRLERVGLPESLRLIDSEAFANCPALTFLPLDHTSLEKIGAGAFMGTPLVSVTLPCTLTVMGDSAFKGSTTLTSVTFAGESVLESIGKQAFMQCTALTSLTLPKSLVTIDDDAFYACTALTAVKLEHPEDSLLQRIGSNAFRGDESLVTFDLRGNAALKQLGLSAFRGCVSLKEFYLPAFVIDISDECFSGCVSLERVTLAPGSRLGIIRWRAFNGCRSLSAFDFSNVGVIDREAFADCISLSGICLPKKLSSLNGNAFLRCEGLTSVTFEEGSQLTEIVAGVFAGCTGLTAITLPDTVKRIGEGAFAGCTSLREIHMASRMTYIADNAFYNCPLLTLPKVSTVYHG